MSKSIELKSNLQEVFGVQATRASVETIMRNTILANPDKIINKNGRGLEILKDLTYDTHVASCIQSRKAGVLSFKWEINHGGNKTELTEFIAKVFDNISIRKVVSEMLEYNLYGFKVLEILWAKHDGYIVPIAIQGKPSHWFGFDDIGLLRLRTMKNINGEVLPQKFKFLLLQHNNDYDNPYGEAILSKCWSSVFIKREIIKNWATFADKYGMPYLFGKYGLDEVLSEDAIDDFLDELKELRADGIAVGSSDKEVSILDASKSGSMEVYKGLIEYCNSEISKAFLSQTLSTEQSPQGGSNALGMTHYQVLQNIINMDKGVVEEAFNKLISWIIELNFGASKDIPKFEFYSELDVDKNLADRDVALASTGQIKFKLPYWQRNYGFKDDEIEIVEPVATQSLPFAENSQVIIKPVNPVKGKQDNTEKLSDVGFSDFSNSSEKLLAPIVEMINNSSSFEEIEKKVIELFPELDENGIENQLAQSFVIANAGATIQ